MGGYGAVKVGIKHHEMFASVNSHSGAVGIMHDPDRIKSLGDEFTRIFGKTPADGPEDPFALVKSVDHGRLPAMRIDCGTEDFLLDAEPRLPQAPERPPHRPRVRGIPGRPRLGLLGQARPGGDRVPRPEPQA